MSNYEIRLAVHSAKMAIRLTADLWGNSLAAASAIFQPHLHDPREHVMLNDEWVPTDFPLCSAISTFLEQWRQLALRLKIG